MEIDATPASPLGGAKPNELLLTAALGGMLAHLFQSVYWYQPVDAFGLGPYVRVGTWKLVAQLAMCLAVPMILAARRPIVRSARSMACQYILLSVTLSFLGMRCPILLNTLDTLTTRDLWSLMSAKQLLVGGVMTAAIVGFAASRALSREASSQLLANRLDAIASAMLASTLTLCLALFYSELPFGPQ